MPVTTTHLFIEGHPFKLTDKKAIIGTIHPHVLGNFVIPFFYGNVGSLWNILGSAFPQHDFTTYNSITSILDNYDTWITDIVFQCDREHSGVTEDALLYNLKFNRDRIYDALFESQIDTIYLTSRFGKNNAAKLFTNVFNINYRRNFNQALSEFIIPAERFGREIKCIVLYSPSGSANIGISKAHPYRNNIQYYNQFVSPVSQFKIDFYKSKFQYLND